MKKTKPLLIGQIWNGSVIVHVISGNLGQASDGEKDFTRNFELILERKWK
jgi:hypothetical protein